MVTRTLIVILWLMIGGCQAPADTRHARYQLAQGKTEMAREQLRVLAESGVSSAQIEYAKLISADEGSNPAEAMGWYQRALDQNDYRAGPASLRLYKRYQGSIDLGEARARALLGPLRPRESEQDLKLALDIAVTYPGALTDRQWEKWLALYRRSCIEACFYGTYAGRYHQHLGQVDRAAQWYQQTLHRDPRAVEYLQDMYWQAGRPERFVDQVRKMDAEVYLDGAYCLRVATLIKANATDAEHDPMVMQWLERAEQGGEPLALHERLQYMLSWPTVYSYDEFNQAIARLMALDTQAAIFFRAQGDLQDTWMALNPERARQDLLGLVDGGMTRAYLPLAELYEKGFLGEADMDKAVMYYRHAAEAGLAQGDMALASLYASGRGISRNPILAYAHQEASKVLLPRTARQETDYAQSLPEALLPEAREAAAKLVGARQHWLEEQFHVASR